MNDGLNLLTMEDTTSIAQDLEMTWNTTPKRMTTEFNEPEDTLWPVKKKLSGYLEKKEIKNCNSRNTIISNMRNNKILHEKTFDLIFVKSKSTLNQTNSKPNMIKFNSTNSSFIDIIKENDKKKSQNFSKTIVNKLHGELNKVKNCKNILRNPKRYTKERNYKKSHEVKCSYNSKWESRNRTMIKKARKEAKSIQNSISESKAFRLKLNFDISNIDLL